MTKQELLKKLEKICFLTDLRFDGPGEHNFRKMPKRDVWHIYFRAKSGKGNSFLREIWDWAHRVEKSYPLLLTMFKENGFTTIECKGGCADLGCSFHLG